MVSRFSEGGSRTVNGGVVRFGAPAGEYHLVVPALEYPGHSLPGVIQSVPGFLAHGMNAGGIPVQLSEVGEHSFEGSRVHRGGPRVIQINQAWR